MCATAVTKQAKISSPPSWEGNLRDGVGISCGELARHDKLLPVYLDAQHPAAHSADGYVTKKIYIYDTIFSCVINKLTSRCFKFPPKCFEKSSATDAGRTILPSPENSPTIADLFSKVWGAEPT